MSFKFEYTFYHKLSNKYEAGFSIAIDENFDSIEHCILNNKNKIIENRFYPINSNIKKNIKFILEKNSQLFNLNSYIYNNLANNDIEQIFYFELNNKNRKIESNMILNKFINEDDVAILILIFKEIANELLNEQIILNIEYLKK